jgi:hypothetical protein
LRAPKSIYLNLSLPCCLVPASYVHDHVTCVAKSLRLHDIDDIATAKVSVARTAIVTVRPMRRRSVSRRSLRKVNGPERGQSLGRNRVNRHQVLVFCINPDKIRGMTKGISQTLASIFKSPFMPPNSLSIVYSSRSSIVIVPLHYGDGLCFLFVASLLQTARRLLHVSNDLVQFLFGNARESRRSSSSARSSSTTIRSCT